VQTAEPVRVRPFRPADAGPARALFRRSVHEVAVRDYAPDQLDAWAPREHDAAAWTASFRPGAAFVAEIGSQLAGFADLSADDHVGRLYVSPDHQRRGVAQALYAALEAEARRRGARRLHVEASDTALGFFHRMGFADARAQRVERGGVRLRNHRMQKPLP
jgi:GNAT superfamily N-acetyltransferase